MADKIQKLTDEIQKLNELEQANIRHVEAGAAAQQSIIAFYAEALKCQKAENRRINLATENTQLEKEKLTLEIAKLKAA